MADNLSATPGSGVTLASDDIGPGVQYPRVKISWGVDGAAVDASASNPFPVVQTGTLNVGTVTAVTAISNALPAGTATIGAVSLVPTATGGLSIHSHISVGTSADATNIKGSAGQLFGWSFSNINAAPAYVKVYNSASAPTAGSGTPVLRLIIPGNTAGAGQNINGDIGLALSSGIGYTIVTGATDASSAGVAANEVLVNFYYK